MDYKVASSLSCGDISTNKFKKEAMHLLERQTEKLR
jgi:hypothetical protein